ncbi:MAG: metallophosphoesterase family protein [Saprospiraceae bacterium]|nr:metallophosphoesterase family protein [Saprospiraceae bacterium]
MKNLTPDCLNVKVLTLLLPILLCCSSSILAQYEQGKDYYAPSKVPDRIVLTLTETPSTTQAVTWRTSTEVAVGKGQLMIADPSPDIVGGLQEVEAKTTVLESDKSTAHYHSLTFTELQPNTQYAYRVGGDELWSEWFHFTTAGKGNAAYSFLYFGDAQNDLKSRWSRTIRGAYSKMPDADFLLHAGDLVNRANSDHEWGEWFYAGGWIYGMMPSIATPGNHEYARDPNQGRVLSNHWKPTFTLPANGPVDFKETVYFFDYHNTRFISLDSQKFLSSESGRAAQIEWLKEVLASSKMKWTILTMHHPVYSSAAGRDNEEMKELLAPLFEEYQVDLVLQGHDHAYGRGGNLPIGKKKIVMEGPVYVVSVSGPKMYVNAMEDWMQRAAANTQLYQLIRVDGNRLRYEAYMVTGELYDAFELMKKPSGKTIFKEKAPINVPERLDIPPRYKKQATEEQMKEFNKRFQQYKAKRGEDR